MELTKHPRAWPPLGRGSHPRPVHIPLALIHVCRTSPRACVANTVPAYLALPCPPRATDLVSQCGCFCRAYACCNPRLRWVPIITEHPLSFRKLVVCD